MLVTKEKRDIIEKHLQLITEQNEITAQDVLDHLIIEGLVAVEQMIDCEDRVKYVLSAYSSKDIEKISSNIIILNTWIQQELRKRLK